MGTIFTALASLFSAGLREERRWRADNPGAHAANLRARAAANRQRSVMWENKGRKGLAKAAKRRAATLDAKAEAWEKKANG